MYLNTLVLEVSGYEPSTFVIWGGAFILGTLGFVGARFRPWLAVPAVALAIYLSYQLTHGFDDLHVAPSVMAETRRDHVPHILLASAIVLFATGQGMRSWMVRYNKRQEQTPPGI